MSDPQTTDLDHLRLAADLARLRIPEAVLPDDRHVIASRQRLHYLDWGVRGGPPVLFLHGGLLTAHTWDLVCLALRKRYHCLALDLRGHGDSEWSRDVDYGLAAHVADVEAWTASLGLDRVVLIGQSLGALVALSYARARPDQVAGLAMVDVGAAFRPRGARRIEQFADLTAELDDVEEFVERAVAFNPTRDRRLLRRSLLHNLRSLPDGKWTWKYDRALLGAPRAEMKASFPATIAGAAEVACPALLIRGARSDLTSVESVAALAGAFPQGSAVEVDAGHTVQGDNPRALVGALRPWLRKVWARR